jgi:hypothetical protein
MAVNKALKTHKDSLGIKKPVELKVSSLVREGNYPCYETIHMKKENDFTIYHIILPYDVKA